MFLVSDDPPTEQQLHNLIDASGDTMFNYGIDVTAKLHAERGAPGRTYFEYITYPLRHSLAQYRTDGTVADPPYQALK